MPEPRDECRDVTLPSGATIRIRSGSEPTGDDLAALDDIYAAARRLAEKRMQTDPGAQSLWARVDARAYLLGITIRDGAEQAGVKPAVLSRLAQGRMPGGEDLAAVEAWLSRKAADG